MEMRPGKREKDLLIQWVLWLQGESSGREAMIHCVIDCLSDWS